MTRLKGSLRKFWNNARYRIVFWATIVGVLSGVTGIGFAVEDVLLSVRDYLRRHPSNGTVALVLQDSRTVDKIGTTEISRGQDADVLEALFKAGAKRVFFDRATQPDAVGDGNERFIAVLKKNQGRVYLGALPNNDGSKGNFAGSIPSPKFREYSKVASLLAARHPFDIGASWPFSSASPMGVIPTIPAVVAGVDNGTDDLFRPDFSIDRRTIPAVSYIDVMRGSFDKSAVRGKEIIIAPGSIAYNDFHYMPGGQGYVPGGYFHAIAAETLQGGLQVHLGWFPPFLLVFAIIVSGVGRGRVLDVYRFTGLTIVLIAAPFVLDYVNVQVEIFPALAIAAVAVFRMRNLDRVEVAEETNVVSGLPSVQALRNFDAMSTKILVALKIRNYGAIIGSFAEHVEAQMAHEIVRRIRISDHDVTVYHEGGMFLWLSNIRSTFDLFENLQGLHRIMQNGIHVGGLDIDLSFNCGIDSEVDRSVSSRVASAMQSAEEAVRNDELFYQHDSRKHEAQWEISLLTQLDRAIDNGEVWVAYQPKLDVKTNAIVGAEALIRWTHPERGPISPDKFIRIAEEFHRIERITRFVINDAVRTAVGLGEQGHDISISVNISAQLLRNPGLPGMISDILASHGLSPQRLVLEITETDRLDRSSRTFQMLQRLVQSGLRLSIDDFGTGNATIDYLRYLPATEVKIDKVFVQAMEANKQDYLLVQSIIEMAHSLDRTVVAEGVETATALEILKSMGCDLIQGYYISRPVPFVELVEWVAQESVRASG